jgi:PTH1 family peptidyl-tRNA hydrolase
MRVVVGLGNPGVRYRNTRHNVGFRLLDRLGRDLGAAPEAEAEAYRVAWAEVGGERIALVKPMVFMNRSGLALSRFSESEAVGARGHLIVHDDVWLPFGSIRIRERGGAGGHKGLESILDHFATEEVPRMRLGVGGAETEEDLSGYVLEDFTDGEEEALDAWLERAALAVRTFLIEGPEPAMNRFNE